MTITPTRLDAMLTRAGIRHTGINQHGDQYSVIVIGGSALDVPAALPNIGLPLIELSFNQELHSDCREVHFMLGGSDADAV